jgi:hypothetical protein
MKKPQEIINNLSPNEALSILQTLAANDEDLARRIAEIALTQWDEVDPEEVAEVVYATLDALEVEELWDRSGSTRHGYMEPGEAADQMIDEVLAPFLADLKKYQRLGLSVQARQVCMGLLAGLRRFGQESASQFREWAPDAPTVFSQVVIEAWKTGAPSRADRKVVRTFIEEELGLRGAKWV